MSNQIVLWAFNLNDWQPTCDDILLATSCIQVEEKERLGRFVFQNDFKASLVGRLMMRKFVSEFTSSFKYDEIRFTRNEKGKPMFSNNVQFNVSHQGDFTVFAGGIGDFLIGVDVVKIETNKSHNLSDYFRLMRRTFSNNEWATIETQKNEQEQLAMFYRHWCLKESYLKAIGIGITINLQDVSFQIKTADLMQETFINDTDAFFKGTKDKRFDFQEMQLDCHHYVAIALNTKQYQCNFKFLSFNELMLNAIPFLEQDHYFCNDFFKKSKK